MHKLVRDTTKRFQYKLSRQASTFAACFPNRRSARYRVTPGEPLANTAPSVRFDGCTLNKEASAIVAIELSGLSTDGLMMLDQTDEANKLAFVDACKADSFPFVRAPFV